MEYVSSVGMMGTNLYRHPPEVVMEAITLHDNGWKPTQIARILEKRGISVHTSTIGRWVHPETAEKDRVHGRDRLQRKRDEEKANRLPDRFGGMTGLSRKCAELEERIVTLEAMVKSTCER